MRLSRNPSPGLGLAAAVACSLAAATPALAQPDLFGRDTVSGLLDARLQAADGEPSFLRGGTGKSQASGAGDGAAVRPYLDLATVAWRPDLGGGLSAYVTAQAQSHQETPVDLAEAFLSWRPTPRSDTRVSARAGLFWPPFSLEHDGVAWTAPRTLTPSAINTWIAEEVKVVGVEGTVTQELAGHRFTLQGAAFYDNDASGTLLTYRGWALNGVRTTLNGAIPLPPFGTNTIHEGQYDEAQPSLELDGRPGGYVRVEWRPPAPVALEVSYYTNAANPHLFIDGQWGWRTTFANLGLTWRPAPGWEVLAQGMFGRTYFGEHTPYGWYVDVDFHSAYVLATRVTGRHRVTARVDGFGIDDLSFKDIDNSGEHGWAATADYAYALTDRLSLWAELLHIDSRRQARADVGRGPGQTQTVLQLALRAKL